MSSMQASAIHTENSTSLSSTWQPQSDNYIDKNATDECTIDSEPATEEISTPILDASVKDRRLAFARLMPLDVGLTDEMVCCGDFQTMQFQADIHGCIDEEDTDEDDGGELRAHVATMPSEPAVREVSSDGTAAATLCNESSDRVSSLARRNEWAAKRGVYSFMQMSLNRMHAGTPTTRYQPGRHVSRGNYRAPTKPVSVNMADAHQSNPNGGSEGLTADQVGAYLHANPDFLERHVMEEVELEQLERWMIRRTQRVRSRTLSTNAAHAANASGGGGRPQGDISARKTSLSRWKFCVHADKRQMLIDLQQQVQQRPSRSHVLFELATCIARAVDVDVEFRLYIAESEDGSRLVLQRTAESSSTVPSTGAVAVPRYVARTRETVRLSRGDVDPRFPEHAFSGDYAHVLCQPICQPNGDLIAVLELIRRDTGVPFHEEDEEIASSYLVWGGIALHYAHLFVNISHQRKLNDFLLCVVKSIFQDMVSMDRLVVKIMRYAQRLVTADRASLFLVDSKTQELYATIFDVSDDTPTSDDDDDDEEPADPEAAAAAAEAADKADAASCMRPPAQEIRFPIGTGIAGQVALNGEILNIADAYADPRFNRDVDAQTGYVTNTILCMPIRIRGHLIGVMQMVNKRNGTFTAEDETSFETFAVYCGLALHHAKLYDKIRRSEQRYRVALEVLSYHNTCTPEEVQHCLGQGIPDRVPQIGAFSFNPFAYDDFGKAVCTIHMFIDLFGLQRFDKTALVRFTLTIRKNYRRVPYHNWTHGFSVANTMYSIIKHSVDAFRPNERLALFIGSLCHDLDHRGKNNKFMLDSASPIAAIYSTSTMEHHHFNQTVTILQQDGHNIFGKLTSGEYKQVLSLVKHCILATDLALFFPNKAKLLQLIEAQQFSWSILEHRMLIQAIAMTASDLSASAKPWDVQVKTVQVIFEEFYQQGDAEREAGRQPIAMMDRNQPDQQAASQVGFLNGICLPCYELLHRLIPETRPLLDMCSENLERWQGIAAEMQQKRDEQQVATAEG